MNTKINNINNTTILTPAQKRAQTIEAKKIESEALALEELQAVIALEQQERNLAFDAIQSLQEMHALEEETFEVIERSHILDVALDFQRYENETHTGLAIKRCDKNTLSRVKRLKAFKSLTASEFEFLAAKLNIDDLTEFERQIYAQDKMKQLAKFVHGDATIFSGNRVSGECCNGKTKANNTLLMTVCYLRENAALNSRLTCGANGNITRALESYGQPSSSSVTQAGSSLCALNALQYLKKFGSGKDSYYMIASQEKLNDLLSLFKNIKHAQFDLKSRF